MCAVLMGAAAGAMGVITEKMLTTRLRGALDQMINSPAVLAAAAEHEAAGSGVTAEDVARESLLCSRKFIQFPDSKISVESSDIAGVGVFAVADIAPGEVITCYPGDAVTYRLPPDAAASFWQNDEGTRGVIWGLHVPSELRRLSNTDDDYALKVDETYGVIGLRALGTDDVAYAGHLANDGASLSDFGWSAEAYMKASVEKANAGHKALLGCHTATIATRHIRCGEEVLVTCKLHVMIELLLARFPGQHSPAIVALTSQLRFLVGSRRSEILALKAAPTDGTGEPGFLKFPVMYPHPRLHTAPYTPQRALMSDVSL